MSEDPTEEVDPLVRSAATRLYAGSPADFVATRTTLATEARGAGNRAAGTAIGALRKPSVAAWLLNRLAHTSSPQVTALAELGARLRDAQSRLDAVALGALREERDEALVALVRAAQEVAEAHGQRLTAAIAAEVRDTGIAALADEAAQDVLGSGTMTRALTYSGLGEVDVAGATATTGTGVVLTSVRGGRSAPGDSVHEEEGAAHADEASARARAAAEEAEARRRQQAAELTRRHRQAQEAVERARTKVSQAEQELADVVARARARVSRAEQDLAKAVEDLSNVQRQLDQVTDQ